MSLRRSVLKAMHAKAVVYHDGLESFLFPLFVPVGISGFPLFEVDLPSFEREEIDAVLQAVIVVKRDLNISLQATVCLLECLKAYLCE